MKKTWTSSEICEQNWWIHYRLRMRGCLCESCKREVGKEMFSKGGGGGTLASTHKNTFVYLLIASGEGTSNNRLWSLNAYGLTGQ